MLTLEVTYDDGRSEIIDHPIGDILANLATHFGAKSVRILAVKPEEREEHLKSKDS